MANVIQVCISFYILTTLPFNNLVVLCGKILLFPLSGV